MKGDDEDWMNTDAEIKDWDRQKLGQRWGYEQVGMMKWGVENMDAEMGAGWTSIHGYRWGRKWGIDGETGMGMGVEM